MDPRGLPFKQRIVNYILGLRASQRDSLVQKINECCKKAMSSSQGAQNEASIPAFINVD